MTDKCFVVYGETGVYDDWRCWPVRAFKTKKEANDFIDKATKEIEQLIEKYGKQTDNLGFESYEIVDKKRILDPINSFSCGYEIQDDINYGYWEIPFKGDK